MIADEYVDMIKAGIIDPAKVTRSAVENAASIAAMILTTEALITDKPEEKGAADDAARRHGRHGLLVQRRLRHQRGSSAISPTCPVLSFALSRRPLPSRFGGYLPRRYSSPESGARIGVDAAAVLLEDDGVGRACSCAGEEVLDRGAILVVDVGDACLLVDHIDARRGVGAFAVGDASLWIDEHRSPVFPIVFIRFSHESS